MSTQLVQSFPQISAAFVDGKGLITPPWRQFLQSLWNRTGGAQPGSTFFSGMVMQYAGISIPTGWLLCDGSAVSRAVLSNLFAALGTTWGAGDGHTTFNVPNLVDKFVIGAGVSPALGTGGGAATVTLSTANLAAHNHAVTDPGHIHGVTDPTHAHTSLVSTTGGGSGSVGATAGNTGAAATGISINSAVTGISTQNTGSATPFSIIPPYYALYYIIKT